MSEAFTNTIYLIRHGENPANLTHEFSYKNVDYSLTPKGRLQAQHTAEYFQHKRVDEIYASPLKRALETAEAIATQKQLPITVMEEFREINVGSLEGKLPTPENWLLHNQVVQAWNEEKREVAFPEGENYYQLLARLRSGLQQVTQGKNGQQIVIVAHGGIITRTMQDLCPTLDKNILTAPNNNCSITELELTTEGETLYGTMIKWATFDHLHGEAAQVVPGTLLNEPPVPVQSQI